MTYNEAFLGRGWAFPPAFYGNGADVAMAIAEEDIRQSLNILLATATGERNMLSSYGCELSQFLFAEIDQGLVTGLRSAVSDAILHHEPRIKVDSIEVEENSALTGVLMISINYTVRTTNNRYNLVYPFYVNEASNRHEVIAS